MTDSCYQPFHDWHIRELKNFNGKVEQLGVQKNGVVFINEELFLKLSEYDKAAFFLHEALIHIILFVDNKYFDANSTEKVRKMVQGLMLYGSGKKYIPQSVIQDTCKNIWIKN